MHSAAGLRSADRDFGEKRASRIGEQGAQHFLQIPIRAVHDLACCIENHLGSLLLGEVGPV